MLLSRRQLIFVLTLLGVLFLVALVDWQVIQFQFLPAWDDDTNITRNPLYAPLLWKNIFVFWRQPYYQLYLPVTYTLWAALVALSRIVVGTSISMGPFSPMIFHAANLIVHLGVVAMVFLILQKVMSASKKIFEASSHFQSKVLVAAAAGALLFGLHPVQVEAVAWVSCFRDLLGAFFSMAAIFVFLFWMEKKRSLLFFVAATLFFLLALGSKPGSVVVPAMAFLLSFLIQKKCRSLRWLWLWFLIAAISVAMTFCAQPSAELAKNLVPIWTRPLVAADSLAFYLTKIFWPLRLCPDYGRSPNAVLENGQLYWAWLIPFGLALLLVSWRRGRIFLLPYALLIVGVAPMLGLMPFNFQLVSTVSDRYLYLAMLGPALALALVFMLWPMRKTVVATALILTCCAVITLQQLPIWQSGEILFPSTLQLNPMSWKSQHNYASLLMEQGKFDDAIIHFKEGLRLRPTDADCYNDLGVAYLRIRDGEAAKKIFQRSLEFSFNPIVGRNLATACLLLKQPQETIAVFREVIAKAPGDLGSKGDLAWILATYPDDLIRNGAEAVNLSKELVLKTQGEDPHFLLILAVALAETGQFSAAVTAAQQAAAGAEHSNNQQKAFWIRNGIIPLFQQQKPFRCQEGFLQAF